MSADLHDDDEGHGASHDEPWLVSYADLMTLLFGFFVVMYSFAAAKLEDDVVMFRREVAKYFGGGVMDPLKESMTQFVEKISPTSAQAPDSVDIKLFPEGAEIHFQSAALFSSGSAELSPFAVQAIKILTEEIGKTGKDLWNVMVEGHTDDVPIRHSKIYPSNWELSAARASSVVRMFEADGFNKSHLQAIGFADTRPLEPNRDAAGQPIDKNRDKNRRILIKVTMTDEAQRRASEERGSQKRSRP